MGLAGGKTHGSPDGLVAAAGLEVGHVRGDLLVAFLLQDIEHAAAQVDAGVVPAAKEGDGQIIDGVDDRGGVGRMRFLMQMTSSPGAMARSRASSAPARMG